jgi:hypothetical protein
MSQIVAYFSECLSEALEVVGVPISDEQLLAVAQSVTSAHENIGMAFYSPPAGEYLTQEIQQLKRDLAREKALIQCPNCNGTGRIYSQGPVHSSDSQCMKCRGAGKVSP